MPWLDEPWWHCAAPPAGTPFPGETDYVWARRISTRKYYYDLAISSIESSVAKGYVQRDSYEYIGQPGASSGLPEAIDAFSWRSRMTPRPAALDHRADLLSDEAYE